MKKFLLLLFVCFLIIELYSQTEFRTKNRYDSIYVDTTIGGIWKGEVGIDGADSVYLYKTGIPDYKDLYAPDLELKMKSLWFETKVYFLFRHLDDSLVDGYINGEPDLSVKDGLENRDATAIYFFLDSSNARLDINSSMYDDGSYIDSIAWLRWVWGANDFEGKLGSKSITSISDLGGEIIQWNDDLYSYTKLSIDISTIAPDYIIPSYTEKGSDGIDSIIAASIKPYQAFGFDIELNENDKEEDYILEDGTFGMQTRAFWGSDMDSLALKPQNITKWRWLYFTYGDTCTSACDEVTFIKVNTVNFASIYPNPASEHLNIQLESYGDVDYKIFDLMGRSVKTGKIVGREAQIDLNNIKTGTYYIQLIDEKGSLMGNKLLILR